MHGALLSTKFTINEHSMFVTKSWSLDARQALLINGQTVSQMRRTKYVNHMIVLFFLKTGW